MRKDKSKRERNKKTSLTQEQTWSSHLKFISNMSKCCQTDLKPDNQKKMDGASGDISIWLKIVQNYKKWKKKDLKWLKNLSNMIKSFPIFQEPQNCDSKLVLNGLKIVHNDKYLSKMTSNKSDVSQNCSERLKIVQHSKICPKWLKCFPKCQNVFKRVE